MTVTNMFKPPDLNAMLFKDAQNYILMICNLHSISGTVVPNDIGCNTMCCWYNQFRPYHHYPSIPHFQMMPPALSRKRGANRVRFCQGAGVCRGISNSRSLAPLSNFSFQGGQTTGLTQVGGRVGRWHPPRDARVRSSYLASITKGAGLLNHLHCIAHFGFGGLLALVSAC
jgi:hypothetical protein